VPASNLLLFQARGCNDASPRLNALMSNFSDTFRFRTDWFSHSRHGHPCKDEDSGSKEDMASSDMNWVDDLAYSCEDVALEATRTCVGCGREGDLLCFECDLPEFTSFDDDVCLSNELHSFLIDQFGFCDSWQQNSDFDL
jgi:hypothetical protein